MKEDVYVVGIIPEHSIIGSLPFAEIEYLYLNLSYLLLGLSF